MEFYYGAMPQIVIGLKLLQKKVVRIITNSNYLAHSEPIFKTLNLLKLEDIIKVGMITFYYQPENKNLPFIFKILIITHHYLHITTTPENMFKS